MADDPSKTPIVIAEAKHGLPFSKGLMAQSFMAAGLPPSRAYGVAAAVEKAIRDSGRAQISLAELNKIAVRTLE